MGLFSGGSSKIAVSSVTYSLAGDTEQVSYLQSTVLNSVLFTNNVNSVTDDITTAYLHGPGMRMRNFPKWAERSGYIKQIGLATSTFGNNNLNLALLKPALPYDASVETITSITEAIADIADFSYWANLYITQNQPAYINSYYVSELNLDTMILTITVTDSNGDPTGTVFTTVLTDYDPNIRYIYAEYIVTSIAQTRWPNPDPPPVYLYTPVYVKTLYLIYGEGTGNEYLDAIFPAEETTNNTYFPIIPFRIRNQRVTAAAYPNLYPLAKTAMRKSINQKYETVQKAILDNGSIDDIDYAYIIFGVPLNTKDAEGKRYLFEFFENMYRTYGGLTETLLGTSSSSTYPGAERYLRNSINIRAVNYSINYNIIISWTSLAYDLFNGKWKTDAKINECQVVSSGGALWLYHQKTENTYERVVVGRPLHVNRVHDSGNVTTDINDAFESSSVADFVIPLQETLYRSLGLIRETQLAGSCTYIMFNCYKRYKAKWYQSTWFTMVIMIAMVAVMVVSFVLAPYSSPAVGATGTALIAALMAMGMSAGAAALLAAIAMYLIKAFAVILLTRLFTSVAKEFLGPAWGHIIGAIAAVATVTVIGAWDGGATTAGALNSLTRADVLMLMSISGINGYNQYLSNQTNNYVNQSQKMLETYNEQILHIQKQQKELFGGTKLIDPKEFTKSILTLYESRESFLNRTLMTSSDICDITLGMVTRFTDISLDLDTDNIT